MLPGLRSLWSALPIESSRRRRILIPESLEKKFRAPGENRNHYPPSTSSEALNSELLEALWRAGLKFNYNYTSHRGPYADQKGAQEQC